jgi:hypothetical protein
MKAARSKRACTKGVNYSDALTAAKFADEVETNDESASDRCALCTAHV